jgi:hypothetical protein
MNGYKRGFKVLIAATLCLLSIETAGALFFLWENGSLIYFARQPSFAAQPSEDGDRPLPVRTPAEAFSTFAARLHPYFGFAGPYEGEIGGLYWNALGALQREPTRIPHVPGKDDIVVAIFGGSVAASLVVTPAGGTPLDIALKSFAPFKDRNVILIAAALSGGKQPQQLFKLAYLLAIGQHIDLVLNVDGFNEFALGWQNVTADLNPVLPAAQNMRPMLSRLSQSPSTERFYEIAYRMLAARRGVSNYSNAQQQARTGIQYAWASAWALWSKRRLAEEIIRYEAMALSKDWADMKSLFSLDMPPIDTQVRPIEQLYDLWLRSSQQMRSLSLGNNIKFVHVIQPNQYYSKHNFSEAERAVALSLPADHGYRIAVQNGYPLLDARREELGTEGILSAIAFFDEINEDVYVDNCCHFNARGETLFAQYVAEQAAKAFSGVSQGPATQGTKRNIEP